MKEKKKQTTKQKEKKYRIIQYSSFVGEFVSILAPFIAMGIANYEEWFKSTEGWKIGLGGSLAMALLGIATYLVTKRKENSKITGGYITLVIGWYAVTFIFMLLQNIMDQLSMIMFFGGLGLLGAMGLDIVSNNYKKKADLYKEQRSKVLGSNIEEEIRKEILEENDKKHISVD